MSAAADAPPACLNALATRSAPAWCATASRTARLSRIGFKRLWCSFAPADACATRRATSNWSRQNGTAQTGTPAASDFCVVPWPP